MTLSFRGQEETALSQINTGRIQDGPHLHFPSKLANQNWQPINVENQIASKLNRISLESVKICVARFLVGAFFCASAAFALADDNFKSKILQANDTLSITVQADHFLKIRNFTQEGGNQRGWVTVTTTSNGLTANVLTASIVDPTAAAGSLEVINSVVIEGPANVTVTCGNADARCFVSYRKDSD